MKNKVSSSLANAVEKMMVGDPDSDAVPHKRVNTMRWCHVRSDYEIMFRRFDIFLTQASFPDVKQVFVSIEDRYLPW